MKLSKVFLCIAAVSVAAFLSSCKKENSEKKYDIDAELTFETTDELADLITRQYSITVNGTEHHSSPITNEYFTNKEIISSLKAPATIDVDVTAKLTANLPKSVKVKDSHKVKLTCGNYFATDEESKPQGTIPGEEVGEYIENMNYTIHYKLNEDGSLSIVR